jgi:hypothetical protein
VTTKFFFSIFPYYQPPRNFGTTHPLFLLVDINDGQFNYVCVLKHSRAGGG